MDGMNMIKAVSAFCVRDDLSWDIVGGRERLSHIVAEGMQYGREDTMLWPSLASADLLHFAALAQRRTQPC